MCDYKPKEKWMHFYEPKHVQFSAKHLCYHFVPKLRLLRLILSKRISIELVFSSSIHLIASFSKSFRIWHIKKGKCQLIISSNYFIHKLRSHSNTAANIRSYERRNFAYDSEERSLQRKTKQQFHIAVPFKCYAFIKIISLPSLKAI